MFQRLLFHENVVEKYQDGYAKLLSNHGGEIVSRYSAGESLMRLSKAFNFSPPVIRKVIVHSGGEIREVYASRRMAARLNYPINENFFSQPLSPEAAYVAGFIAADGCIHKNRLSVALAARDAAHLRKILDVMGSVHPIATRVNSSAICKRAMMSCLQVSRFAVRSKRIVSDLISLGIYPNKTTNCQPWAGREPLLRHWWRGMFDGDGGFSQDKRTSAWTASLSGTFEICQAFADYYAKVANGKGSVRPKTGAWECYLCDTVRLQRFFSHLYEEATISLDRKHQEFNELMSHERKTNHYGDLSKERLLDLFAIHKTWTAVANALDMPQPYMSSIKRRHGIANRIVNSWDHITADELLRLHREHKKWKAVASHLGMPSGGMVNIKRRLGIEMRKWKSKKTAKKTSQS